MSPEEKAKELFDKLLGAQTIKVSNLRLQPPDIKQAKRCALIVVDEITSFYSDCKRLSDNGPLDFMGTGSILSELLSIKAYEKDWADLKGYWQQVKEEIEKL